VESFRSRKEQELGKRLTGKGFHAHGKRGGQGGEIGPSVEKVGDFGGGSKAFGDGVEFVPRGTILTLGWNSKLFHVEHEGIFPLSQFFRQSPAFLRIRSILRRDPTHHCAAKEMAVQSDSIPTGPVGGGPDRIPAARSPTTAIDSEERNDMETPNAFLGKAGQPTAEEVSAALGAAAEAWKQLVGWLAEHGVTDEEWKSTSPKYGWSLRLKLKKRTIAYLAPCPGCFRVAFVLGDRAVAAAFKSNLPKAVQKAIHEAPRYAEGTGLRLIVKAPKDLAAIHKLAAVKLEN
jgi:hypothetical protein